MKLRRYWIAKILGAQIREVSLPEPDYRELVMASDATGVGIWEGTIMVDDDGEPLGSPSLRLLIRYVFGGEVKRYAELHDMKLPDFPFNQFMYSEPGFHLGTLKGWMPISVHDVVVHCYKGEVPPVRLTSDGSG